MKRWIFLLWIPAFCWGDVVTDVNAALNKVQTLKAQVVQTQGTGQVFQGQLLLKRPGKMKLTYEKPAPYFFVSDGENCVYMDAVTEKPLHLPGERLPLSFLLGAKTDLRKHFKIKQIHTTTEHHVFDVVTLDNMFQLQLIFSKNYQMKGWRMIDFEGNHVAIQLQNVHTNDPVNDDVFTFQQKPRWQQSAKRKRD